MMFCPKCGSLMIPKKDGSKKVLACTSCNYKNKKLEEATLKEKVVKKEKELEVVEDKVEGLPLTDAECPKCKHKKAFFWTVQTRASDEPETKFLKCENCKHTWRDYS
jgi:DNA-directed RNA polymerase subunit M